MKNFGIHKNKMISSRLGISAVALFVSVLVLFAVAGIFQNASLAQAGTEEATSLSTEQVKNVSGDADINDVNVKDGEVKDSDANKDESSKAPNPDMVRVNFVCNTEGGYLDIENGDHETVEYLDVPVGSTWDVHLDYDWYQISIYYDDPDPMIMNKYLGSAFPYPKRDEGWMVSGWNVEPTGVITQDVTFRLLFEHCKDLKLKWDSSLGYITSSSGGPHKYREGSVVTFVSEDRFIVNDRGHLEEIWAHPYEHVTFDGWFINGIRYHAGESFIFYGRHDIEAFAQFSKTLVRVDFQVPSEQQSLGRILVDGESLPTAYVNVGWGSGYIINGSTITFNTDGHIVKAQPNFGSNAVFNGWYDMAGNRLIDGPGIVPGPTVIYAHFIKAGVISGTCYDNESNNPVQANVSFYTEDGTLINTVKTNTNGEYAMYVPLGVSGYLVGIDADVNPTHLPSITESFTVSEAQIKDLVFESIGEKCLIYGLVTDAQTGEPIANANMFWYTEGNAEFASTTTDMFGLYYFIVDQNSAGYVAASAPGYEWAFHEVTSSQTEGQICMISFGLTSDTDTDVYFICDTDDVYYEISYYAGEGQVFTYETDRSFAIGMEYGEMNVFDDSVSFLAHLTNNAGEEYYQITAKSKSGKRFINWLYNGRDVKNHTPIELFDDCVFGTKWQDQCAVSGHVKNDGEQALENISVYYVINDNQIFAKTKTDASGNYSFSADCASAGRIWFIDNDGTEPNYNPKSYDVFSSMTKDATLTIPDITMDTVSPSSQKLLFGVVKDSTTNYPIPYAIVSAQHSNGSVTSLANAYGEYFIELPSSVSECELYAYAQGYDIYYDSALSITSDFLEHDIELLQHVSEVYNLKFIYPEHIDTYNLKFWINDNLLLDLDYKEELSFDVVEGYYFEIDDAGHIIVQASNPFAQTYALKYEVTVNPDKGYTLNNWDVEQVASESNAPVTSDLIFTPYLSGEDPVPGVREFTLIGGEGHAGFSWTYYENAFPVDWGWNWTLDNYVYPYSYVWVDEDGSITTTKYYEITDWPHFGVAKTVVQTIPQEGYEFDYLTVNGYVVEKNSGFYVQDLDWGIFAVAHYKYGEQPDPPGPVPPGPVPPGPVPPGPVPPEPVPPEPSPEPIYPEGGGTVVVQTSDYTWVIVAIIVALIVLAGAGIGISQYLKRKKAKGAPKPPTTPGDGVKVAAGTAAAGAAAAAAAKPKNEKEVNIPRAEAKTEKPAAKPESKAEKPAEKPEAKKEPKKDDKPKDDKPKHAK